MTTGAMILDIALVVAWIMLVVLLILMVR